MMLPKNRGWSTGLWMGMGVVLLAASGAGAQIPSGSNNIDAALSVGGTGTPLPGLGAGYSYGVSSYTPTNSSFPLTFTGYGKPVLGAPGSPILGGLGGGYGFGAGSPVINGSSYSPTGGIGYQSYESIGGGLGDAGGLSGVAGRGMGLPFSVVKPSESPSVPPSLNSTRPRSTNGPILSERLTPLAAQSALKGAGQPKDGTSKTFNSKAKIGGPAPANGPAAGRPADPKAKAAAKPGPR